MALTGLWDVGAAMRAALGQSRLFWFVFLAMQKMNARPGEGLVQVENNTSYLGKT